MKSFKITPFLLLSCIFTVSAQQAILNDYLKQLATSQEDSNKVRLLSQLSRRYLYYQPDSALLYANDGLHLSEQLKYPRGVAQA